VSRRGSHENDHIDGYAALLTEQGVFDLDDEFSFLLRCARDVGDFGDLAADEQHALVEQPLIKLLIILLVRPHVDVAGVYLGACFFHYQVAEFKR